MLGLFIYHSIYADSAAGNADIITVKRLKNTQNSFVPGQSVVYTITVTNNGPDDAMDVVVIDDAPNNTTITAWTATVTTGTVILPATNGTGNLHQTIAVLPNGATVTYEVTVTTPSNYTGNLINTASVTSSTTDPNPGCPNCAAPTLPAIAQADLVTTKNLTDPAKADFAPGEVVEYTIVVKNDGPSDAQNVVVRDIAPVGTIISGWTATVTTGTVTLPATSGTGDLNQLISTLPDGAVITYQVSVQTPGNYIGDLTNTVAVTSSTRDPRPACSTCTVANLPPSSSADIVTTKVLKDPTQANFAPGDAVVYIITVTNNGPSDATDVRVQDNAPAGTTISEWTATVINGTFTLPAITGTGNLDQTIAVLPDKGVVAYEVTVQTPSDYTGPLINTAVVTSTTPDPNPDPDCLMCTTPSLPPSPSAHLSIVKTLKDPAQADFAPGEAVVYTIVVANQGPSNAVNVNVRDIAPAGTTISAWSASVTNGVVTLPNTSGTGDLNETIALLPNGAAVTYEVTVQTPSDFTGPLINTASATSTTPDPNPDPDCPMCTPPPTTSSPSADLVLVKTLKDPALTVFTPGDAIEYIITVTNNGPSDAADVQVKDDAPTGTTITAWTATVTTGTVTLPATSGTGNLDQTIPVLPNGAVITYEVTVQTPVSFPGGPLVNTASVTSSTPDPNPDPDCPDCTTTIPSIPTANIFSAKSLKDPAQTDFAAGEAVVYIITIRNSGPDDATDVNVQDIAPPGTTISAWTATVSAGAVALPNLSGTGDLHETIPVLSNGSVVTYEVTVQTPSDYTGTLSNIVTVTTPTNDPDPACPACTTPAMPSNTSADIVTVKKLQDDTQKFYMPGEPVVYEITVTNNGPSDAADIHISDIAPTGTTISGWSATVTNGTVTLPNTSGTSDLDETITVLPNGAVVTYEVTVLTDETFTGSIQNIVTVTSATPDPDNTCETCGAPVIVPGSKIPPMAIDDGAEVKEANTVVIPILNNDIPGDLTWGLLVPSSVKIIDYPAHGTIVVNIDGTIEYKPTPGYTGTDTFTYQVQDESGNWSNVATVTVEVLLNNLEIPNMITPNGDGVNDRLVIKGLEKYTQHELVIFNRWNNMLYRSNNYQGQWDGQGLHAGTYYYTLKVLDIYGKWHTVNGYVMLMR
jgi:gliding motility-associated-like protein/uncharacterized repeat protein (TIGR01451 family)